MSNNDSPLQINKISSSLGATISNIDLANVSEATFKDIEAALDEHLMLVFPNQVDLTPEAHAAFMARFGELVVHAHADKYSDDLPQVCLLNSEQGGRADVWHTDVTYIEKPPIITCSRLIYGPDVGGETLFANLYKAYNELSDPLREMLDGMTALHSSTINPNMNYEHPAITIHPHTGKRSIYLNRLFTTSLRQLAPTESRTLLNYIYEFTEQPEFCTRHRWSKGDVVMWDNRCTLHYAVGDYDEPRLLHRCLVMGEKPVGNTPRWGKPKKMKASSKAGMVSRTGESREAITG
jgi:taurine dioxygenase